MAFKKKNKHSDMIVKRKSKHKASAAVSVIFKINMKIIAVILNILLTVLLIGIICGAIIGTAFAVYINNYIDPKPPQLTSYSTGVEMTTTVWYRTYEDRENKTGEKWIEWESERLHSTQNRFWAKYSTFPEDLVNAFIAIEDKRFKEHKGVDWWSMGNVAVQFLTSDSMRGGSTITQQLIKLMTGEDDQRVQRKFAEMLKAMNIEKDHTKEEILENYLNIVSLSQGCYGVQAAANTFFGKDVSELTLLECAALAAIVKSPTKYDPVRKPEFNKERRQTVLLEMCNQGYISKETYYEVKDQDLVLNQDYKSYNESVLSYYTDQAMNEIIEAFQEMFQCTKQQASNRLLSGGYKIYLAMDKDIQEIMEDVYMVNDDLYFPKVLEGEKPPQSSMVVIDPHTGDLLGIVGGRGQDKVNRGLNRASQSPRQVGSSIKPVASYALALDQGLVTYGSPVDDSPAIFLGTTSKRGWPTNYPPGFLGGCNLYYALQESKNTVATKLVQMLTPEYVYDTLKNRFNFNFLVDNKVMANGQVKSDVDLAPLALGGMTYGVTIYELTGAYGMLANKGIYCKPRAYVQVLDQSNNIIIDNRSPKRDPVISEETAAIMTQMLRRVVDYGTAKTLAMKNKIQVAAKTGTTNDDKDKTFVGYTPYYLCGVWFGYDNPQSLARFGFPPALNLFNTVMDKIHTEFGLYDNPAAFDIPPTVVTAQYCKDSGMMPSAACKADLRGNRIETGYFAKGMEPINECTAHVLVDFCEDYKCVAGPECPNTRKVALIRNETREFPIQVWVADAQFTYRDVPVNYIYPSDTTKPFYANILKPGTYVGTSGAERPYNSFCSAHNYILTLTMGERTAKQAEIEAEKEAERLKEEAEKKAEEEASGSSEENNQQSTEPEQPQKVEPTTYSDEFVREYQ